MNELYNDMSSSSDESEEETKAPAASGPSSSSSVAPSSASKDSKAGASDKGADDQVNPFKRQASNAQEAEALRELYGEDY